MSWDALAALGEKVPITSRSLSFVSSSAAARRYSFPNKSSRSLSALAALDELDLAVFRASLRPSISFEVLVCFGVEVNTEVARGKDEVISEGVLRSCRQCRFDRRVRNEV